MCISPDPSAHTGFGPFLQTSGSRSPIPTLVSREWATSTRFGEFPLLPFRYLRFPLVSPYRAFFFPLPSPSPPLFDRATYPPPWFSSLLAPLPLYPPTPSLTLNTCISSLPLPLRPFPDPYSLARDIHIPRLQAPQARWRCTTHASPRCWWSRCTERWGE
ncbi:hypothetical protein K438DRAFT_1967994 [Mycena galopus ATCC 62051]|nr:hypothetical protein K438DRAFT_1967994 [Mycena galopus ATCC 62051]